MGLRRHTDASSGETRRVRKLGERISEARRLRGLVRDPDLQAVEMERQGRRTLAGLWFFLALGLTFTSEGVQRFLAGKATAADPLWWVAWTVEPMFAGLLIVLLNFEAVILSHGIAPDHAWWYRLKHVLLASTLGMNVIPQLAPLLGQWEQFNLGSLAVHAIIPVIVYGIAEVIPVIQARQRQVILQGYEQADQAQTRQTVPEPSDPAEDRATDPAHPPATVPRAAQPTARVKGSMKLLPPEMAKAVAHQRARVAAEGREFTAADVQQVLNVPGDMADRIVADLAVNNGHPVT